MNWIRRHLIRVGDGSPDLFWGLARRAAAGTWRERGTRALALLVVGWVWWQMLDTWAWLTGLVLLWWIVKAWRAADVEERVEEQQAEAAERRARAAEEVYLRMLLDVMGNDPGIHLETLLDIMRRADPGWPDLDRDQLRGLLDGLGVPVRRSLRVGDRTGVAGVHRDDAARVLAEYLAGNPSPGEGADV